MQPAVVCRHLITLVLSVGMLSSLPRVSKAEGETRQEAQLRTALHQAYRDRGDTYSPRTEHWNDSGEPAYINRLIHEDSPYLLQHAHNPVNWYAWGAEAFETARRDNKPIFLSIGYATCHWCHVMAYESFDNEFIAEWLNEHFIAIKVDRERRPGIDSMYMTAVQMMTGGGGWPLSVFLNPEGQPFFGATYLPTSNFHELLQRVTHVWTTARPELDEQAEKVAAALASAMEPGDAVREVGDAEIARAVEQLLASHDDLQGGFGDAPKFPREPSIALLLQQAEKHAADEVLQAANFTLQRIFAGGIHDHLGGGFHRYAVDPDWLVPHFEKMLYNQAGLARVYLKAWQLTDDVEHRRAVRRTLDFVLAEMRTEDGLFYSALDADSDGAEGRYYIWEQSELEALLSPEDAKLAMQVWNITPEGNFEHHNILHLASPIKELAAQLQISPEHLTSRIDTISERLLETRKHRPAPARDEKVITAWNAMMITTLAEAGVTLDDTRYLDAAHTALNKLLAGGLRPDGRLSRIRFDGSWSVDATQPDYAFLAESLLVLYDSSADPAYLSQAVSLVGTMNERFRDDNSDAYFINEADAAAGTSLVRPKDLHDNALPSGNAAAARVLVGLWRRTGEDRYQQQAQALFSAFSDSLSKYPSNFPYMALALGELLHGSSGSLQYAARGKLRISASIVDERVVVRLSIAEGWHINASEPIQDYLIGTALRTRLGEPIAEVSYPEPELVQLGFQRAELALYQKQIEISAPLPRQQLVLDNKVLQVSLDLQACNDTVCLAPETVELDVPYQSSN